MGPTVSLFSSLFSVLYKKSNVKIKIKVTELESQLAGLQCLNAYLDITKNKKKAWARQTGCNMQCGLLDAVQGVLKHLP